MKKMCVENLGFAGHSVSTNRKIFLKIFETSEVSVLWDSICGKITMMGSTL